MKQATGIRPLVTLICLLIGVAIAGPLGAILAVPAFISSKVILKHLV
jgi:predicted PurR-regulated permease PerM